MRRFLVPDNRKTVTLTATAIAGEVTLEYRVKKRHVVFPDATCEAFADCLDGFVREGVLVEQ